MVPNPWLSRHHIAVDAEAFAATMKRLRERGAEGGRNAKNGWLFRHTEILVDAESFAATITRGWRSDTSLRGGPIGVALLRVRRGI